MRCIVVALLVAACGSRNPAAVPCFAQDWHFHSLVVSGPCQGIAAELSKSDVISLAAGGDGTLHYSSGTGCDFTFEVEGHTAKLLDDHLVSCAPSGVATAFRSYTISTTDGSNASFSASGDVFAIGCSFTISGTLTADGNPPASCTAEVLGVGKVEILSGDEQTGIAAQPLAPIRVRAVDADGHPLEGKQLTLTADPQSGTISATKLTTGKDGTASFTWTPPAEIEGRKSILVEGPDLFPARAHASWLFGVAASLSVDTPAVFVGGSTRLTATARDAAGRVVGAGPVSWSTTDPSLVALSADGTASGLAFGSPAVTATLGSLKASRTLTVGVQAGAPGVSLAMPVQDGQSTVTGQIAFGTVLGMQVTAAVPTSKGYVSLLVLFDKDGSGTLSAGDDGIQWDGPHSLRDWVLQCGDLSPGCFVTDPGGRFDGSGRLDRNGTTTTITVSHPLASTDPSDVALRPSDVIGVRIVLQVGDFMDSYVESAYPGEGFLLVRF